jgi:hypothetical protein
VQEKTTSNSTLFFRPGGEPQPHLTARRGSRTDTFFFLRAEPTLDRVKNCKVRKQNGTTVMAIKVIAHGSDHLQYCEDSRFWIGKDHTNALRMTCVVRTVLCTTRDQSVDIRDLKALQ